MLNGAVTLGKQCGKFLKVERAGGVSIIPVYDVCLREVQAVFTEPDSKCLFLCFSNTFKLREIQMSFKYR